MSVMNIFQMVWPQIQIITFEQLSVLLLAYACQTQVESYDPKKTKIQQNIILTLHNYQLMQTICRSK